MTYNGQLEDVFLFVVLQDLDRKSGEFRKPADASRRRLMCLARHAARVICEQHVSLHRRQCRNKHSGSVLRKQAHVSTRSRNFISGGREVRGIQALHSGLIRDALKFKVKASLIDIRYPSCCPPQTFHQQKSQKGKFASLESSVFTCSRPAPCWRGGLSADPFSSTGQCLAVQQHVCLSASGFAQGEKPAGLLRGGRPT